jgi:hypothetical protein
VKLDLMVILAGMQPIEIGDAIDAEQDRLAVDHERGLTVLALPQRSAVNGRSSRGHCG